ncbi:aminotransferase class V-fold PLP-dependent enzyme [Pseudomaricurvus alkylphenolicus]|uniref:aminotransferase class V-fold PLP-dependent enzyme n=1 Tax=Pseudomaricurvus alkylphenolicus TaxID=1306991 RepID=UPI001420FFAB|nr:aminotransferase class V-fold PLP-dependent enzyme [Pseudomaricurvus alkylphenolicus]NIB44263.1 aminotransferase class V-fold PLP-dependent enzyme [Pseudomaricurvus alkylphenolicus]
MAFDNAAFKRHFPLFEHAENTRLVYLDNAATTQRPSCVIEALTDFYSRYNANTHRSSHRLARAATAMVERVRQATAEFVNASDRDEIIFTRGATEALNLLAQSLARTLEPGDQVLLSAAEHHANLVPWQMAAEQFGLELCFLPDHNGEPQLERLPEFLNGRLRVVALSAASNALGFRIPVERVKNLLPECCRLVVDASQILAHQRVDVQAMGCDFLVGSAHKFYGPTGVGLLYGRREALSALPPWQGGGEMIRQVRLQSSDYAEAPHRFEAGTSALAAIAGLGAALEFLEGQDRKAMATYESHLNRYLHTELEALCLKRPLQLLTRFENNVGIAALVPSPQCKLAASDIADWLDEHDIAVRVGHHCAQPLMESLGQSGSLRISLAAYNNREDVDRLLQALSVMPLDEDVESAAPSTVEGWVGDDLSALSLQELSSQSSWQKRYRQLTRWATQLSRKPAIRVPEHQVHGCESEVWLVHRVEADRHRFAIDTDSRVIQGLSILVLLLIDNRTRRDIEALDLEATFAELGLEKYLSPSRSNGFRALLDQALALVRASSRD